MAAPFSADMGSLYAAECGIPLELKEKVVDGHLEFFKIADNYCHGFALDAVLHDSPPNNDDFMYSIIMRNS